MDRVQAHPPADGVLHHQHGDAHEGDGEQVDQDERGAAVGAGHVREFPDVAQADGGAQGGGEGPEGGSEGVPPRG